MPASCGSPRQAAGIRELASCNKNRLFKPLRRLTIRITTQMSLLPNKESDAKINKGESASWEGLIKKKKQAFHFSLFPLN